MKNFTIFLYHDIRTGDYGIDREGPDSFPYVLESQSFRKQMKGLSNGGFPVISLAELVQSFREGLSLGHPTVCLTFDDGHVSNFTHAFPTLRHFGFTACFFLTASEIGTRQALSWPQIRSMADAGMEIGSDGLTHVRTS
jgi:peptidoglycan/xylan/chitin deacetylase (PgdA/CDA1 family)